MIERIWNIVLVAALLGGTLSLAGCTVGKNPQHGNSIYDTTPSSSGNGGNSGS